jgi:hypothetical protein
MFTPPQRQSMSDSELQEALGAAHANEAGILGAMELLEQQSALRETDDQVFNNWVAQLTQIGSREALHAIENAKRAIAGLEPLEFEAVASEPAAHSEELFRSEVAEILDAEQQIDEPAAAVEPIVEQPVHKSTEVQDDFAASLNRLYSMPQSEKNGLPEEIEVDVQEPVVEPEVQQPVIEHEVHEPVIELEVHEPVIGSAFDEESSNALVDEPQNLEKSFDSLIAVANESPSASSAPVIRATSKSNFFESPIWKWVALFGAGTSLFTAFAMKNLASNFATAAVGVALGFLFAGLAGVISVRATWRSGQPSLVTSRAAFGVFGNVLPGIVSIAGRVVLFAAAITASIFITFSRQASTATGVSDSLLVGVVAVVAVILGLALARLSKAFSKTHFGAAVAVIVLSIAFVVAPSATAAESAFDAGSVDWAEAFILAAINFGVVGSLISPSAISAENLDGSKGKKFLTLAIALIAVPIALTIPTMYAVFAADASSTGVLAFAGDSVALKALVMAAAAVSAVIWSSLQVSSISSSVVAVIPKMGSRASTIASLLLISVAVAAFSITLGQGSTFALFGFSAHLATIPVLAWAGVFVADALIRTVAYHDVSLMRSYGFYKPVNVANLAAWIVATALGFAVFKAPNEVAAGIGGFGFGIAPELASALADSGVSPFFVFGIAFLAPILFGIPRIRSQEHEVLALEARRDDLKDIFKFGE